MFLFLSTIGDTQNSIHTLESEILFQLKLTLWSHCHLIARGVSESGVLPLVSQVSINSAASHLNGTMINCTERSLELENIILWTTVHIIDVVNGKTNNIHDYHSHSLIMLLVKSCILFLYVEHPNSPEGLWRATKFTTNNATVIVEWEQEIGVSYNVSVLPNPLEFRLIEKNTGHLTVLYNTSYRVTVVATLCGRNMNMTAIDVDVNYIGNLNQECIIITVHTIP